MKEERISKQKLEKLYSVNRATIDNWVDNYGLPMIKINSHSRFVKKSDLIEWENEKKENRDKLKNDEIT